MDNDLLKSLESALAGKSTSADGAYTTREISAATGKNAQWVRDALREAINSGAWETVRSKRQNLAGIAQMMIAYRPIPKKPKKR